MPVEIVRQRYLYRRAFDGLSPFTSAGEPFRYNSIHDVESLWWIGLYFMMNRAVGSSSRGDHAEPVDYGLFRSNSRRYFVLRSEGRFSEELAVLHPSLRRHSRQLIIAREQLLEGYRFVERQDELNLSKVGVLLVKFQNNFYKMTSRLRKGRDFEVLPPYDGDVV